jgi:cobalt-zinc-cadmium efflux system outer membrane protein
MLLRAQKLFCPTVLILAVVGTVIGQELTEKELIERLLAQSPQVRALRAGLATTRAEVSGRTLYPNPSANYTREGAGFTEFLEFEQPLILSNRRSYLRAAGSATTRAAELSIERTLWEMRAELRRVFYQLLEAQEKQTILQSSLGELEEVVGILRRREIEGEGSRFDRLRVERELFESRADLAAAEVALAQLQSTQATLVSAPEIWKTRVAGRLTLPPPPPDVELLLARALSLRQDFLAGRAQLDRFANEKLGAERLRIPDPIVRAGLKRGEGFPTTRTGSVIAVTVPIPLFNRGQAEVTRAEAEYEKAQARLDALERQIRAEVPAAHAAFDLRRALADQYRLNTEKSGRELVRIARIAYEEGEKSILELLDVYRASRQAELRGLELLAATKQAQIELDRVVGEEVFP